MNIRTAKILNSIVFFASKENDESITRLKLMKLLWLADRIHLNKYGRLILKDSYNALPHGPIPSSTLDASKISKPGFYTVSGSSIKASTSFDNKFFSRSDIEVMELVWSNFGSDTALVLRDFSHQFPEWIRFENDLNNSSFPNSYKIIIEDFFSVPAIDRYSSIISSANIIDSKTQFRSHSSIQSCLDN